MEEARASTSVRNREVLEKSQGPEEIQPKNDQEMIDFLRGRLKFLDITVLPEGERLDKISSFSKVDYEDPEEKKTLWEKIYDNAMARISGNGGVNTSGLRNVEYYEPKTEDENNKDSLLDQIPQINIKLPDGMNLRAAAYEHIPLYSTQIDVLPNRILKVSENIVVVANGEKVKEGLIRFFNKKSVSGQNRVRLMLDSVLVNGESFPYELIEQNDLYAIRPMHQFKLSPGVYVFEFRYLVDKYLMDLEDFYEFYWDVTGSQFNLLTARAIAAIKLPGREPAVKQFALTGTSAHMVDNNAIIMKGIDNTIGFMNLVPLREGESLHLFMTLPKIDFQSVTQTQKLVELLEDYGDIALCLVYVLVVAVSCLLSWQYIRKHLKFRNITLPSAILIRSLWRGGTDQKSLGGALLDLFRKNIIDIESHEKDVILVRKSAHARHLSKFESKVLNILFSKKDGVCKIGRGEKINKLRALIAREARKQMSSLGIRLGGMYILFNILMLIVLEIALCLWNPQSLMFGILVMADIVLFGSIILLAFAKKQLWKKVVFGILAAGLFLLAVFLLKIYLNSIAIILMLLGIAIGVVFNYAASGRDAMLKNAVQSVYQMREFLLQQQESVGTGRNFAAQQANIFVLDLEDKYPENPKIKSHYRLKEMEELLKQAF